MSEIERMIKVKVTRLNEDIPIPTKATKGSAFYDIYAKEDIVLRYNLVTVVPTGLVFEVPTGYEIEVRPRSGLSLHKILVANSPGTLDSDYRGELKILLLNLGNKAYQIKKGDRIAQIGIRPSLEIDFKEVSNLSKTTRGQEGLGSTGG